MVMLIGSWFSHLTVLMAEAILFYSNTSKEYIDKYKGRPIRNLKTLELTGSGSPLGLPIDLEFATYVVENSIMLKDVIFSSPLSPQLYKYFKPIYIYAAKRVSKFGKTLPSGVAFKYKIVTKSCTSCTT